VYFDSDTNYVDVYFETNLLKDSFTNILYIQYYKTNFLMAKTSASSHLNLLIVMLNHYNIVSGSVSVFYLDSDSDMAYSFGFEFGFRFGSAKLSTSWLCRTTVYFGTALNLLMTWDFRVDTNF
jgi:hypothetical protein